MAEAATSVVIMIAGFVPFCIALHVKKARISVKILTIVFSHMRFNTQVFCGSVAMLNNVKYRIYIFARHWLPIATSEY